MNLESLINNCKRDLAPLYPPQEVQAICHLLFEEILHLTPAAIYISLEKEVEEEQVSQIKSAMVQLLQMRPIQQILGKAQFYGLTFEVNEHTLIPRPETEELVEWILHDLQPAFVNQANLRLLDIGTGSGCIAVSLAKNLPQSKVHAWDISEQALEVARKNAEQNEVKIEFAKVDILSTCDLQLATYDLIVSNPPYVCENEKLQMHENVLRYEPHTALFVEDSNPLVFYSAIADFAKKSLIKNEFLYFEINANFGNEVVDMLKQKGFLNVTLRKDINGKDRMVRAQNL